jgi:hypothetical protein
MPAAIPDKVITDEVKLQIADASSPESVVTYNVAKRADQATIGTTIQTFEIRGGPADSTSYHDFYKLQIAFEHIWTELYDDRLEANGALLFANTVQEKGFQIPEKISTVDELKDFMGRIRAALGFEQQANSPSSRLKKLLNDLDGLLSENYAFPIFVPNTVNYGIMVNYRQKWKPLNYQVGNLVSTIPLAPLEVRRYTTKSVAKKQRNVKEIDDALEVRRKESTDTSRVDAEIVQKALNKTNFQITASESFGSDQTYKINAGQSIDQNQAKESSETKREFRETVLKSVQEYRNQHRLEVSTDESVETESTNYCEIRNPNDELPVTYLFYELQRTYEVSEKLHKLTPVILVANDVPWPHQINESWLITHDWILKRAILDDSFLPALEYLSKSFVGSEVALQVLEENVLRQKQVVDNIGSQVKTKNQLVTTAQNAVQSAINAKLGQAGAQDLGSFIKSFFDPLNLTQSGKMDGAAIQTMVDASKDALDRAQKDARDLVSQLETETTALQVAVDKYAKAVEEHFTRQAQTDRLRAHVKDNILYYMQAIWSHEPPDQRYFRLYKIQVPIFHHATAVDLVRDDSLMVSPFAQPGQDMEVFKTSLPSPAVNFEMKELNEVADLDNLLGFKGNYMIFPLTAFNYLTYFMMQDYIDVDQTVRAKDPDKFGNFTLDDLEEYMRNQHKNDPVSFSKNRADFKTLMIDYLSVKPNESDLVIVPTTSLYIEALPGTHPLLEDFKLIHRAVDVKRAQAEVRHAELENARLASRVLKGNDEDPDIEKKILVAGAKDIIVSP